jgi:hypothetical protein
MMKLAPVTAVIAVMVVPTPLRGLVISPAAAAPEAPIHVVPLSGADLEERQDRGGAGDGAEDAVNVAADPVGGAERGAVGGRRGGEGGLGVKLDQVRDITHFACSALI